MSSGASDGLRRRAANGTPGGPVGTERVGAQAGPRVVPPELQARLDLVPYQIAALVIALVIAVAPYFMPSRAATTPEALLDLGRSGRWEQVIGAFAADHTLGRRTARFADSKSGWTLLHEAARAGNEAAVRILIEHGADAAKSSNFEPPRREAREVAEFYGHKALAELLDRALEGAASSWAPSPDPETWPASGAWKEARPVPVEENMAVAYAGSVVKVEAGTTRWIDEFGRTLIGWHGSYNPPTGMDGEPMVETQDQ
ncbi:hypothetical protein DFJ74DRAFT_665029 [Hyaloraphidium curvatum]|nr:hypothetical protein DFJ74DRAFT_665029 [Hyaloraphidium curvatum]